MKVLGLITEYNPFHNGHLYHLEKSKSITDSDYSIAVMSGHFMQRGEPAMINKWLRAEMAIKNGVDLVVELPTVYACSTADQFARGSIALLNNMNIIDHICFGSESGDIDVFEKISNLLTDPPASLNHLVKHYLNKGHSFARAQQLAISNFYPSPQINSFFQQPNNILGMLYMKHLKQLKSSIIPYTIKRLGSPYHSKELSNISSATGIRTHIDGVDSLPMIKSSIPAPSYQVLKRYFSENKNIVKTEDLDLLLMGIVKRMTIHDFRNLPDVTEGLENKLNDCAKKNSSSIDFCTCVKSKRYPRTRIQRILMHALLNIQKTDTHLFHHKKTPSYIRVLAFNEKGRFLLRKCKELSSLPIITKVASFNSRNTSEERMLEIDLQATDLYHLSLPNSYSKKGRLDYLQSPLFIT
ncbi:nucleotidyltransferase [Tindallia californiensis]|uniref:tRNA(Met) cytidine acetate ligase n=1 Tax=Tindallia californiensis TaxID=159292 RepID=A0A1H3NTS5_9FIRM|nr:nucleotidyltransferase [Tindallia californiensis]SDY92321.1 Predicted nucleotidyltransferase [Tindallia californiensis]